MNYKVRRIIYKIFNLSEKAIYVMKLPDHHPYVRFEGKTPNPDSTGIMDSMIHHYRIVMKHNFLGFVWFSYPPKWLKDLHDFDIKIIGGNFAAVGDCNVEIVDIYPFKGE